MPTLNRSTANLVAGLLALALTAGLVIRTSSAVFTAQTDNDGNSLEAGTIVLDDDGATALLTMSNIAPGEYSQNCIVVEYDGSLDPEPVLVFSTSDFVASVAGMEGQVNITIVEGNGNSTTGFGDCDGFAFGTILVGDDPATLLDETETLASWDARATDYGSGDGTWDPGLDPNPQSRMYRITLELDEATGNAFQGASLSGINISWATQSTATPGLVP